ncbi:hypothetical protein [Actinomycetospora sp. CA-053990]|uniref:hypothetical protein n=1 Tax=Actinomycetospora sp. CA-053990 TaxID=3239891 RepID=UPI003D8A30F4
MVTNIASSAIFVLLGATILDQWLKREDLRRLRVIESTAYDAVARPLLAHWRALWMLMNGGRQLGEYDFEWPESEIRDVQRILSKFQLSEVHHSAVVRGFVENPDDVDRLCVLVTDEEWRALVYKVVRRTVHGSRRVTARWAQLFVTSRQSSEVLQELTACLNDLQELRIYMLRWVYDGETVDPVGVERFIELWRKAYVNSIVTSTQLESRGGTPEMANWQMSGRLLQDDDRRLLSSVAVRRVLGRRVSRLYTADCLPQVGGVEDKLCPAAKGSS